MIDEVKLYNFLYPIVKEALEDSNIEINRYKLNEVIENSMFDLRHAIYSIIETLIIKDYEKDVEDGDEYSKEEDSDDCENDDEEEDEEEDEDEYEEEEENEYEGTVVKVGAKKSYSYIHLIMEEVYEMLDMKYNKEIIDYQVDIAMNDEDLYADIRNLLVYFIANKKEECFGTRYLIELSERLRNEN